MTVAINSPYNSDLFYVKNWTFLNENSLKPIKAGFISLCTRYYKIAKLAKYIKMTMAINSSYDYDLFYIKNGAFLAKIA